MLKFGDLNHVGTLHLAEHDEVIYPLIVNVFNNFVIRLLVGIYQDIIQLSPDELSKSMPDI